MPYYGDHRVGDPGLFGFLKKIKLGRIVGGLVKSTLGAGSGGVLSAVQAIRGTPDVKPVPILEKPTVVVPTITPTRAPILVTKTRARRARAVGAQFTARGKAESPFARRMRLARAAKRRSFGRR